MSQKCVHQGCGKLFSDPSEKCEYHPGPPVFHEGQKGKAVPRHELLEIVGKPSPETPPRMEVLQATSLDIR